MSTDKTTNEDSESEILKSHLPENTAVIDFSGQKTWQSTQEIHLLAEEESATHIALEPELIKDLKANGMAEKFELVDAGVPEPGNGVTSSYIHGLKAISLKSNSANEAEMKQAEFSINYILRKTSQFFEKANEIFSKGLSQNEESGENLEIVSDSEAADTGKCTIPANQPVAYNPAEAAKNEFDKYYFTHRNELDKYFDKDAARFVSQHLPKIAAYSERNEGRAARVIRAIMRNEQMYYGADDALFDGVIRQTGDAIKSVHNFTAGPGQISISNIQALAAKYSDLFDHKSANELCKLSIDPFIATLLVGAYIDDRIELFERWTKTKPDETTLSKDERLLFKNAFPLWVSGLQTQAIIMSFNPGGGRRDHLSNVLKHLRILEAEK